MRDLLGDEERQEVATGPLLALGAEREITPDPPRVRQMQSLE